MAFASFAAPVRACASCPTPATDFKPVTAEPPPLLKADAKSFASFPNAADC